MGEERTPLPPVPATAAPRSKRARRGPLGQPGPGEFRLVVTPFGLASACLVAVPLLALIVAGYRVPPAMELVVNVVSLVFWVQALRTLHRTARLLPAHGRPTTPTTSVVLLLIPCVGQLLSIWIYPVLARGLRTELERSGTTPTPPLWWPAIAAGSLPMLTVAAVMFGVFVQVEWVGEFVALLSVLAATYFFHSLQLNARELAHRAVRGSADGDIVSTFE